MRVQDEEPGHRAGDLDGDDGVTWAVAHCFEDFRNRAQKPLGLVRFEFDCLQCAVFLTR